MSRWQLPAFGLFGRTYAVMLASVLLAESLIVFMLMIALPQVLPVVPFSELVKLIDGKAAHHRVRVNVSEGARPVLPDDRSASARLLGLALDKALDLAPGTVHASVSRVGPPQTFAIQLPEDIARGEQPMLIAGDFVVARPISQGRWRTISTDTRFTRNVIERAIMLLLGTFAVVIPFAYVLARRTTLPIRRFADAADRFGRDLRAPPLDISGPVEVRMASEAFNRMRQRLASYVEERTTMITAVAHDLRTPLMRMAFEVDEADPALRRALMSQIDEMRDMIDAIMRFLREEQTRHERHRLDLISVIEAVCDNARRHGGAVTLTSNASQRVMLGDPHGLRSVFVNLIDNALTYGRQADVVVDDRADSLVVTVSDAGPGLPDSELERVFEPFYRVETSRNRLTGGIGLGLAVVRSIVVAHGGQVTLANAAGGGLVARVELPLSGGSDMA